MPTIEKRKLTFWEELVWLSFNPGWMQEVNDIKEAMAKLIDMVAIYAEWTSNQKMMLAERATTLLIEAQMMCVKVITYKH